MDVYIMMQDYCEMTTETRNYMHVKITTPPQPEVQLLHKQQIAAVLALNQLSHTTVEFEVTGEYCRNEK